MFKRKKLERIVSMRSRDWHGRFAPESETTKVNNMKRPRNRVTGGMASEICSWTITYDTPIQIGWGKKVVYVHGLGTRKSDGEPLIFIQGLERFVAIEEKHETN